MAEAASILLPCETKAREFASKLLLSCALAERGLSSFVGSRNHMHMLLARFPRSVYLGKDIRYSSKTIARIATGLGHRFTAHDEEGLIYYSRERYREARVDAEVLHRTELLFAWGPDNAKAWIEHPSYSGVPIINSGNGRIDLLRPELRGLYAAQVAELQRLHGRFVLINSNFGSLNHFYKHMTALPPPEQFQALGDDWKAGLSKHRYALFRSFLDLLPWLAKQFPDLKFVLRPHPGENHDIWREAAAGNHNIVVDNAGSAIPWILASKALVHNGCTTGLEAYFLGVPAIAFRPVRSETYDLHLPNNVSLEALSPKAVASSIQDIVSGQAALPDRESLVSGYVASRQGPLASDKMADQLAALATDFTGRRPGLAQWSLAKVHSEARAFYKRWHSTTPGHKSNAEYTRHRFPDTQLEEVRGMIDQFGALLGRFSGVTAKQHSDNVFVVRPAN